LRETSTTHHTSNWTPSTRILISKQPGFGPGRINAQSDSLGFDAAWEIDLFGHVRRSVEAARADLDAERANYQDAQVTVAAEVARNYFELRGAQKRLAVARENLATEHQTLELTQLLDETGRGSELDVQRSRARLKATEATIPPLTAAEKQAAYRLAVLLSERPGELDEELRPAAVATYAKALPIGDPTELLRRRPDVRAAERQLAAATARVGVATARPFSACQRHGFRWISLRRRGQTIQQRRRQQCSRLVRHADDKLGGV